MYWVKPGNLRNFAAKQPLAAAFCISLAIHLALFGTWRVGKHLGWWDHQATWLLNLTKKRAVKVSAKQLAALQQRQREIQLTFMEVDPAQATEPPKDAKFYGVANVKAANPDPKVETEKPKADGERTEIPKTETVLRPQPLQPSVPQPDKAKSAPPGDLAKAKAEPDPSDTVTIPTKEKVRTLAAARTQKNIAGEKMKQDGGVRRHGQLNFDVKETPFGAYDAAFIAAVQQRWFDLLDNTSFTQRSGRVVLEFHLMYNGQIVEMKQTETEVGEVLGLICQKAVQDPAPYAPWPRDMRMAIAGDFRPIRFVFIYY
jgi:hypothetical protein